MRWEMEEILQEKGEENRRERVEDLQKEEERRREEGRETLFEYLALTHSLRA